MTTTCPIAAIILALTTPSISSCSAEAVAQDSLSELNSEQVEYGGVIDPKNGDAYFVRTDTEWGKDGHPTLLRSTPTEAGWSRPEPVFPIEWATSDPFLTSDGEYLYFTRNITRASGSTDSDIWRARRFGGDWSAAAPVEGVNSEFDEYSPVTAADGTLYFASAREGGFGQGDLWRAAPAGDRFDTPSNLGPAVNTPTGEWNVVASSDGSVLIFEASGRDTNLTVPGDLYVSYLTQEGWSVPLPLGSVNTTGSDLMARFSPDGKMLHYSSSRRSGSTHTDLFAAPLSTTLEAAGLPWLAVVSRSAHEVVLIDLGKGEIVARMATGKGPHEVAASPSGRTLFVPAYGSFPTPHKEAIEPGQISWRDDGGGDLAVWSMFGRQSSSTTICPAAHGVVVTPNDGHVWITCEESGEILELDDQGGQVLNRWLSGGKGTHQLTVDSSGRFVIAANTGSANVTIIDRRKATVSQVATGNGAEGLAVAADGKHVWVGNAQANTVSLVEIATGQLIRTFPSGGRFPVKVAAFPRSGELWVVNTFSRSVAVFDKDGGEKIATLEFDTPPLGIIASPDGSKAVLSFPRRNQIAVFERASRTEVMRIGGIMEADGMAWVAPLPRGE